MKIGTRQQALGKSQKKFFAYRFVARLPARVKITPSGVNSANQWRCGS